MKRIIAVLGRIGTTLISVGLATAIMYALPFNLGWMTTKEPLLNAVLITVPAGFVLTMIWLFYYFMERRKPAHA